MELTKSKNDLLTGEVWKKLFIFFVPIAAGTCIQQLYNAVDGFVVGRFVGTVALAAVGGSASQIINVLIGFFVAVTSGASVVIAQIFGAGKAKDVQLASGCALLISAIIGIILAIVGYLATPILLNLLKTPANTVDLSILYLKIYFTSVPFVLVLNMESNMLRAVGDSYHPFIYMVVGCITNIILDILFVVIFHWGVAGVAIATVISQVLNMILLSINLLTCNKPYRLNIGLLKINRRFLSNMMRIGIPSGLQSAMYSVSNMIIQVAINTLGTVVVASWAMSSKTDGIYWGISNALGSAITAFIAQNFGAGKTDRVKLCVKQGLILSLTITVVISSILLAIGRPVLRVLTEDAGVIDTTYLIMLYCVPFYFTWSFVEVYSAVLRGSGDAKMPVVIIGIGICLLRIIWVFTIFKIYGTLACMCIAYVVSWIITGMSLMIYYKKGNWLKRAQRTFHH